MKVEVFKNKGKRTQLFTEFGIITNYGWLILSATKLITFDQIKFKNNEKIHIQFVSCGRDCLFL